MRIILPINSVSYKVGSKFERTCESEPNYSYILVGYGFDPSALLQEHPCDLGALGDAVELEFVEALLVLEEPAQPRGHAAKPCPTHYNGSD